MLAMLSLKRILHWFIPQGHGLKKWNDQRAYFSFLSQEVCWHHTLELDAPTTPIMLWK